MEKHYKENYEELSKQGALMMIDVIKEKPNANITLATGGSPKRMYEIFVEEVKKTNIDISQVIFTKLDEWCGLDKEDEATCEYFIQEHLLKPLSFNLEHFIGFNPETKDIDEEIKKMNQFLELHPIDLCILGLGMNGHLGLNEPNEHLQVDSHKIAISAKTKTHDMIKRKNVEYGVSMGMGNLMKSKKILMLISGDKKEEAYTKLMKGEITTHLPASFLWLHSHCVMLIDKEKFTKI